MQAVRPRTKKQDSEAVPVVRRRRDRFFIALILGRVFAQTGWAYLTALFISSPLGLPFGLIMCLSLALQFFIPYSVHWPIKVTSFVTEFFRSFLNALASYPLFYLAGVNSVLVVVRDVLYSASAWFSSWGNYQQEQSGRRLPTRWNPQFTAVDASKSDKRVTPKESWMTLIMQFGNLLALALWVTLAVSYLTPFVLVYAGVYAPWLVGGVALLWGMTNHYPTSNYLPIWGNRPYSLAFEKTNSWLTAFSAFFQSFCITLLNLAQGVKVYLLDPLVLPFRLISHWLKVGKMFFSSVAPQSDLSWDQMSPQQRSAVERQYLLARSTTFLVRVLLAIAVGVVTPILPISVSLSPVIIGAASYLFFTVNQTRVIPFSILHRLPLVPRALFDFVAVPVNAIFSVIAIPVFACDILISKVSHLLSSLSDVMPSLKTDRDNVILVDDVEPFSSSNKQDEGGEDMPANNRNPSEGADLFVPETPYYKVSQDSRRYPGGGDSGVGVPVGRPVDLDDDIVDSSSDSGNRPRVTPLS